MGSLAARSGFSEKTCLILQKVFSFKRGWNGSLALAAVRVVWQHFSTISGSSSGEPLQP